MPSNSKFIRSFDLAGVYMIRNKVKGKVYIGSSRDVISRLKDHENSLRKHKHPNKEMQSDYDAGNCFYYEYLFVQPIKDGRCIREKLYRLEREYIEKYNSIEKGYNSLPVSKSSHNLY